MLKTLLERIRPHLGLNAVTTLAGSLAAAGMTLLGGQNVTLVHR